MRKKRTLLTRREIQSLVKKFDWAVNKNETQLSKVFAFDDYVKGLVFIARISVHAEVLKHHPVIEFSYGKVKVKLSTHELKGLTKLDAALLERIEKLLQR